MSTRKRAFGPRRRFLAALGLCCALAPAMPAQEMPIAEQEAAVAAQWRQALGGAAEPRLEIEQWTAVAMGEQMLELRRLREAGAEIPADLGERVADRVIARWRRERPQSGGPDIFRLFRLADRAAKEEGLLALLESHPGDELVLWQSLQLLRERGDAARSLQVLRTFRERRPKSAFGFQWLADHWRWREDEAQFEQTLLDWAQMLPPDPKLVAMWLASDLPRKQPAQTAELVAGIGTFPAADRLALCHSLKADGAYRDTARRCLAGIAGGDDPALADRALTGLAEIAAKKGDHEELLGLLANLPPPARGRALLAAARWLKAPEDCPTLARWLGSAVEAPEYAVAAPDVAAALAPCATQLPARSLFLDLLARAPADDLTQVVAAWPKRRVAAWAGEPFPAAEAAAVLSRRLERGPRAAGLYRALDAVYRAEDRNQARAAFLLSWRRDDPGSFLLAPEAPLALATVWAEAGRSIEAVALLREKLAHGFDPAAAEAIWKILAESGGDDLRQADAWVQELMRGRPDEQSTGSLLAARQALLRDDWPGAAARYLAALQTGIPRVEVAAEYVAAARLVGKAGEEVQQELARRLCGETRLAETLRDARACASDLLLAAGEAGAAAGVLALRAEALADDPRALAELAQTAASAGRWDEAEEAGRRLLALAPTSPDAYTRLGAIYSQQGKWRELEELTRDARRSLDEAPAGLLVSLARAQTQAGRSRQAVDAYLEAKGALVAAGGGASHLETELRAAYAALGSTEPASSAPIPAPVPASREPVTAADAAAMPELLRQAEMLNGGFEGRFDRGEARRLIERAASSGNALARMRLALMLEIGGAAADRQRAAALAHETRAEVRRAAESGSAYAQYLLGTADSLGLGADLDLVSARAWLERAAAQDQPWALHNLGWMASTGRAFAEGEASQAAGFYRRAAELGNAVSMYDVALLGLVPGAAVAECAPSIAWLERSAKTGFVRSTAFLGKVLLYGRGPCAPAGPARAAAWLEQAVAAGEPGAAFDLGLALLAQSKGGESGRAVALIGEDAARNDVLAIETLAWLHATGLGVARDPVRARGLRHQAATLGSDRLSRFGAESAKPGPMRDLLLRGKERLEPLATAGDAAAGASLAELYQMGYGVSREGATVLRLATPAAQAGDPDALRTLGHLYSNPDSAFHDAMRGLDFFRRGAEVDESFCMMFYGQALIRGEQIERDLEQGLAWLTRSAEAGNRWAIGTLGRFWDTGSYGLRRDPAEAARWKRKLAALGDEEARGWLLAHGEQLPN
jgi:TPR repeat protein